MVSIPRVACPLAHGHAPHHKRREKAPRPPANKRAVRVANRGKHEPSGAVGGSKPTKPPRAGGEQLSTANAKYARRVDHCGRCSELQKEATKTGRDYGSKLFVLMSSRALRAAAWPSVNAPFPKP